MFKSKHKYITFNALHKKDTQVQCDLYSKVSAFEQPPEHHMVSRLIQNWKKKIISTTCGTCTAEKQQNQLKKTWQFQNTNFIN